nr:uncharacterized protein LOC109175482 [Ipomoea trifida]
MTEALAKWNMEVFGNVNHRKKIVLARLGGVQNRLSQVRHNELAKLEKKLLEEYHEILYQEELMWFQRSREEWIVSGDHDELLKTHVREYYMKLFSRDGGGPNVMTLEGSFPTLTPED